MTQMERDAPAERALFWNGMLAPNLTPEEHLKIWRCYTCGFCNMPECSDHTRMCQCGKKTHDPSPNHR